MGRGARHVVFSSIPPLGALPVLPQPTRSALGARAEYLDRIMREDKHTTANRSLAAIRKLFNWAVERGHIEQSPCAGLRAPANLISRDRVLSDDELVAVWKGAARMSYPYGPLVHLSILTGQRLDEVAGMQWSELNTTDAFWSIAASRNKSARPHEVPLPPSAIRVIATIPKITERYVFPARSRDVPVSGFSKWKSELDQLSKVEGWRVHDLRRTAATGMAKLGIAPHVVERVLNHKSGTLGGIAGVYNRFGYLTEMRAALDAWSDHLGRLRPSTDDMARSK